MCCWFLTSLLFLSGCGSKGQSDSSVSGSEDGNTQQAVPDDVSTGSSSVPSVSTSSFALPACAGKDCCDRNAGCVRQCDDIFPTKESKEACFNLPVGEVAKIKETLGGILKTPSWDDLRNIELQVLWSAS